MVSTLTKEDLIRALDSGAGFMTRDEVVAALMPKWNDTPEQLLKRVSTWASSLSEVATLPRTGYGYIPRLAEGCVILQPLVRDQDRPYPWMIWIPELLHLFLAVRPTPGDDPVLRRVTLRTPEDQIIHFMTAPRSYRQDKAPELFQWLAQLHPEYDALEVCYVDAKHGQFSVRPVVLEQAIDPEADAQMRALVEKSLLQISRPYNPEGALFASMLIRGAFRKPVRPLFYHMFYPFPLARYDSHLVALKGIRPAQLAWALHQDPDWAIDRYQLSGLTGGIALPEREVAPPDPFVGVYRLSIRMRQASYVMTLDVPATHSFWELHRDILDAVEFDDDHLWTFQIGGSHAASLQFDAIGEAFDPGATLGELSLEQGQAFTFIFDFGDWWEFDIQVKELREHEPLDRTTLVRESGDPPTQYPNEEFW